MGRRPRYGDIYRERTDRAGGEKSKAHPLPARRAAPHLRQGQGAARGACGTCHVLIDGKATKACVPSTDKLEGKTHLTVEGLSDWEKAVYTYAFGKAGAVQCGFCIPGMVISAKALLDANPAPTREEAAFAIRNNICRCTGYVKIIDGILLAAEIFRNGKLPEEKKTGYGVGERAVRVDVAEKVQGYGKYPDDLYVDGMTTPAPCAANTPRAGACHIKEKAEALPAWSASTPRRTFRGRSRSAICSRTGTR